MAFHRCFNKRAWEVVALIVWLSLVAVVTAAALRRSQTPGRPASPPTQWPPLAAPRPTGRPWTLVLFVHPRCTDSRSTIGELLWIMARVANQASAHVYFYHPGREKPERAMKDLWSSAAGIPGVVAWPDPGGEQARRFGAFTSGQALLYDSGGRLRFHGGITRFRGHFGSNDGSDAIVALVAGQPARVSTTPVFGCSLEDEAE